MQQAQDYPINALPKGHMLGNYQIENILGVGGFGITYLAEDLQLKTLVAIKEYLPSDIAIRSSNTMVLNNFTISSELQPKCTQDMENFKWGLEQFLLEAQTIASLKHPNIVQVKHFFEKNNTAYIVMDYEPGNSLNKLLKKGESVDEEEVYKLIRPLLDGLKVVHSNNLMHRDISPSNIYIYKNTDTPILIDFGAARYSLGVKSKSMSTIVKVGYAPYEQYQTRGNQGAWSDIYAMGAVLYQLISGHVPIESTERISAIVNNEEDPLEAASVLGKKHYSQKLLIAIDWALSIREKDRPQSIDEWLPVLVEGKKIPSRLEKEKFESYRGGIVDNIFSLMNKNFVILTFGVLMLLGITWLLYENNIPINSILDEDNVPINSISDEDINSAILGKDGKE